MAIYGVTFVITYTAWDTVANAGKTGDVANHTLRWIKDGTASAPTNTPTEVDATNLPGVYKLTLTATEAQATFAVLGGKSSTAGVSIMPISVAFEQFPTNFSALSISAGGLVDILQTAADKVWSTATRALTDKVGFALSAAGVQAIWDALTSALTTIGSVGKRIADNLDATVSSRSTYAGGDTAGTTTLLTRVSQAIAFSAAGNVKADLEEWRAAVPNALTSGKVDADTVLRGGTAQAGAAGSITLDTGASAVDQFYRGALVLIASGTGAGQARLVGGYTGASKVATVTPNWTTAPDGTSVFIVRAWGAVDIEQVGLTQQTARDLGLQLDASVSSRSTYAGGAVASVTAAVTVGTNNDKTGYTLSAAGVQAVWDALTSALTTVGSIGKRIVDFLTGDAFVRLGTPAGASVSADVAAVKALLPAALVGGRIDASVGAMAAGVQTTASYAVGAIDATVLASNAEQAIADKLLATAVEGTITVKQLFEIISAAVAGKLSGGGTTAITIRDVNDTRNCIVATVDSAGNRSALTFTLV